MHDCLARSSFCDRTRAEFIPVPPEDATTPQSYGWLKLGIVMLASLVITVRWWAATQREKAGRSAAAVRKARAPTPSTTPSKQAPPDKDKHVHANGSRSTPLTPASGPPSSSVSSSRRRRSRKSAADARAALETDGADALTSPSVDPPLLVSATSSAFSSALPSATTSAGASHLGS